MTDETPVAERVTRTERFDIFRVDVEREPAMGIGRTVYMAWHHSEDIPRPVCTVTIGPMFNYVEWINVEEGFRRQGVATEVLKAIEDVIGECQLDAVTSEGLAFCEAYIGEEA